MEKASKYRLASTPRSGILDRQHSMIEEYKEEGQNTIKSSQNNSTVR